MAAKNVKKSRKAILFVMDDVDFFGGDSYAFLDYYDKKAD